MLVDGIIPTAEKAHAEAAEERRTTLRRALKRERYDLIADRINEAAREGSFSAAIKPKDDIDELTDDEIEFLRLHGFKITKMPSHDYSYRGTVISWLTP